MEIQVPVAKLFKTMQLIETAIFAIAIRVAQVTGGRHIIFISAHNIEWTLEVGFFTFLLAPIANVFIKLSLTVMMLRIKGNNKTWRRILWVFFAVLVVVIPGTA